MRINAPVQNAAVVPGMVKRDGRQNSSVDGKEKSVLMAAPVAALVANLVATLVVASMTATLALIAANVAMGAATGTAIAYKSRNSCQRGH